MPNYSPSRAPAVRRLGSAGYERDVRSPNNGKRDPATPSRIVRKSTPPTAQLVSLPDSVHAGRMAASGRRGSTESPQEEVEDCTVSAQSSLHVVGRQMATPKGIAPPLNRAASGAPSEYDDPFESDSGTESDERGGGSNSSSSNSGGRRGDMDRERRAVHLDRHHMQPRPQHPKVAPGRPAPPSPPPRSRRGSSSVSSSATPPPPPLPTSSESPSDAAPAPAPAPAAVPAAQHSRTRPPAMNINISKRELIGRGSFGNVYKAIDEDTDRIIAVKEVLLASSELRDLKKQVHQLEREIRVMQKLHHPNIVQYLGARRHGTELHIYMEFVTGGTIAQLLRSFGKMKEPQAARYTQQLLLGLEYLHDRRIAHRDLKGDNLFVETTGVLKVGDFGTSKELQTVRLTDSVAGTPNFMAPEVIACSGHSFEADVWSVGCCVIQMLTGHPPFHPSDNHLAVMFKVSKGEIESELPSDASVEAIDFIRRCTAKEPSERWTCKQLLQHPWILGVRASSAERATAAMGRPAAAAAPLAHRSSTSPGPEPAREAAATTVEKSGIPLPKPSSSPPPEAKVCAPARHSSAAAGRSPSTSRATAGGRLPRSGTMPIPRKSPPPPPRRQ